MEFLTYTDPSGARRRFIVHYIARKDAVEVYVWRSVKDILTFTQYFANFVREDDRAMHCGTIDDNGHEWTMNVGLTEAVCELVHRKTGCTILPRIDH